MADVSEKCLLAFKYGDKNKVIELLPKMQQPQNTTFRFLDWGSCALVHLAAFHGWDDMCQILVETYHCDPTAKNDEQRSPLHLACRYDHVRVVDYLLRLPNVTRTINDNDIDGHTPLYYACKYAHFEVLEALLRVPSIAIPTEDLTYFKFSVVSVLASRRDWWKTECFILPYFNIFMTGNSGSGKSTLATLLVELTQGIPSQHGKVSGVKTLTAGVCHMQCIR